MHPKIIDLVNSKEAKKKPIELLQCLQTQPNSEENYYFFGSDYSDHLKKVDKVTRLTTFESTEGVFDVIETETDGVRNVFIGHWNDGYVE